MPEELRPCWDCWRVILDGHATYTEVEEVMSIDDVQLMCMAADYLWDVTHPKPR